MHYRDLMRKLDAQPFKPFRIRMSDARVIDVLLPRPIIVGETRAVIPTCWGTSERGYRFASDWKTIALNDIVELTDLDVKPEQRRRRA